jgi:hypothetical protein
MAVVPERDGFSSRGQRPRKAREKLPDPERVAPVKIQIEMMGPVETTTLTGSAPVSVFPGALPPATKFVPFRDKPNDLITTTDNGPLTIFPVSGCRGAGEEGVSDQLVEFLRMLLLRHHSAVVKHFQPGARVCFQKCDCP